MASSQSCRICSEPAITAGRGRPRIYCSEPCAKIAQREKMQASNSREARLSYLRAYHAAHREEAKRRARAYYQEHREEMLAYHRQYHHEHREPLLAYG
jgi:hypothetical protein